MAAQKIAAETARRTQEHEQQEQGEPPPAGPGLNLIRPGLEHRPKPRDPFAVNVRAALEALNADWGPPLYLIGYAGGWWRACSADGGGDVLTGLSPDDIAVKMRADLESRGEAGEPSWC